MTDVTIRPVEPVDRDQWLVLWQAYHGGSVPADATRATWDRFMAPDQPVHALIAQTGGRLIGLAHFIIHPDTSRVEPACHCQDLFTLPAYRRQGIGRRLLSAVCLAAEQAGAATVHWWVRPDDRVATKLFDQLAMRAEFAHYLRTAGAL